MERNVELRLIGQECTIRNGSPLIPNADQVIPAPSLQMGEIVAGLVIPVGQQDHFSGNTGAVRHLAQGLALVLFVLLLHDQIGINAVFQVKKRIHMPEIPAMLAGRARAVGGRILRIRGGFER